MWVPRQASARLAVSLCLTAVFAFAATVAHGQAYSVLYNFGSNSGGGDPEQPSYSGIVAQGRDGNLYTTAQSAGGAAGAVFKITPSGALTELFKFDGPHGSTPNGGLTLGSDGNFYGTTGAGGVCCGVVFKITPSGAITVLYKFSGGSDGGSPVAPPIQGWDGSFYGTTTSGIGAAFGTIYKITSSGKFKTIYRFTDSSKGAYPFAPLVQGTDGNFYGTTNSGGAGRGTIFKITPGGRLTVLFNFDGGRGTGPTAPLIQGSDGYFYGTAATGGPGNVGTLFKMGSDGTFLVLHNFSFAADGGYLYGGIVESPDGDFYGATHAGALGFGSLYKVTPGGVLTALYNFDDTTGAEADVTLVLHTTGVLYGDTSRGGTGNVSPCATNACGVFYGLSNGLAATARLVPKAAKIGKTIGILGQGFTGTTAVSFNGTPATTFKVVSSTFLTAKVPPGATTGYVTVTSPGGTLSSNQQFVVIP